MVCSALSPPSGLWARIGHRERPEEGGFAAGGGYGSQRGVSPAEPPGTGRARRKPKTSPGSPKPAGWGRGARERGVMGAGGGGGGGRRSRGPAGGRQQKGGSTGDGRGAGGRKRESRGKKARGHGRGGAIMQTRGMQPSEEVATRTKGPQAAAPALCSVQVA